MQRLKELPRFRMAVHRTARPISIRPSLTVFNPWPPPNMFSLELSSHTLAGRNRSKNPTRAASGYRDRAPYFCPAWFE
jgi:hypothetical protein